jgi:hypothetical protein
MNSSVYCLFETGGHQAHLMSIIVNAGVLFVFITYNIIPDTCVSYLQLVNWTCSEVDLGPERYGTHHTKMIILFYPTGEFPYSFSTVVVTILHFDFRSSHCRPHSKLH